jgi:hypothetical protein
MSAARQHGLSVLASFYWPDRSSRSGAAANTLQIADIEGVLRSAIAWMLAFERAERMFIIRDKRSWMSLLFHPGFFQSGKLGFGEHQAILV